MPEIGTYVVPVIASFDGITDQINKGFGDKFKVAGAKVGKDLAKGAADGLKLLEAEVDSASKAYGKLQDKAQDALGKIRAEEEKLKRLRDTGASNDKIVVAEERLSKARRDGARATREAADGHGALLAAQSRLGSGTDDLGGRFSKLSGLASTAGAAVTGLAAAAAAASIAGIALLAAGAVTATRELYDLGAQFDDLSDNLRVKTGATGDALDGLTKSVENIAKSTPDSIAAIGDVVAETTRSLHLTGPELENVSKNISNLNRLSGEDTNIRGLGKAFRAFGVDAKDQVSALDQLFTASQHSGLSVNDLVASVSKGAPALKALGFNFGQSAALVTTFEESSIDADKAIAGLTKSTAAFAKDGKSAPQGLRDTVTEIGRLIAAGDEIGAQNLANKIFGAKGGVGFFDAVKSGSLDLATLSASLDTTGDTIQAASDDTGDWAEQWQVLKNKVAVALEPLGAATFNGINEGLGQLSEWASTHQTQIIDAVLGIGDAVIDMGSAVLRMVGMTLEGFGQLAGGIGNTVGVILGADEALQRLIGNNDYADQLHAEKESWYGLGEGVQKAGRDMQDLAGQSDQAKAALHNAGDAAKDALNPTLQLGDSLLALSRVKIDPIDITVNARPGGGAVFGPGGSIAIPVAMAVSGGEPPPGSGVPGTNPLLVPGHARGGVLPGYSPGKDNMLVPMSGGEGVIIPPVMKALGPRWLAALNSGRGYAEGGVVGGPDVDAAMQLVGTGYNQGNRTDCSGMVARVIDRAMGLPESDLMSTKTAKEWLTARGFRPGTGGPGQISVGWYDHGPNPNDGHMAMTLSDGSNAESGGSHGDFLVGAGAKGANDPAFDQHMFLPTLFGEGQGSGGASSPFGASSTSGGSYSAPDPKAVREATQKADDADVRVKQAEQKQKELKADAKQSEKDKAQADVDKAKREAADAKSDLAEVQKGKFTPGKAGSGSGKQGGLGQFGELGGIAGSFLKETFGIDGSFLPDLSSLGIVQSGGALLNAFKGPLQGLVDGGLGIQQPGWSPGMPVNGVAAPSLSPFGMSATQMPGGIDVSTGIGTGPAPGPVTIDNSTTINSPTGDPNDIENRIRRTNMNRPRIDSYAMPGT